MHLLLFVLLATPASLGATPDPVSTRPADAAAFGHLLRSARPGDVVMLPESITSLRDVPLIPIEKKPAPDAVQLLFSDDPEYYRAGNGISLQEDVKPGRVRIYVYHVTESKTPKTITAVIENRGSSAMRLRFLRYAFPKPGKDYQRVGKQGLVDYFNSRPEPADAARTVPSGGRVPVDPRMDAATVTAGQLVHGFYDIEIDQPARVSVFQRDPGEESTKAIDSLPKPPPSPDGKPDAGAGRGLFLAADVDISASKDFVLDPVGRPIQLVVADGKTDPWLQGRDSIAGRPTLNKGNYGVVYRIRLRRIGTPENQGHGLAVLMVNPYNRSKWCDWLAAAVRIDGCTVPLPARSVSIRGFPAAALISVLPPLKTSGMNDLEIIYSPPGASCLPTPLLFVPYPTQLESKPQ